jgi:hypothetical protein
MYYVYPGVEGQGLKLEKLGIPEKQLWKDRKAEYVVGASR